MEDNRYACIYCESKETVYIGDMENIDGSPPEYEYFCLDCYKYFDEIKEEKQMLNTPINEMTPEQVRREIAERQGYQDIFTRDDWWSAILDGEAVPIPDWPNDAGAALALCATFGDFYLNHCDPSEWPGEWEAVLPSDTFPYNIAYTTYADTPALALSKLALLALREMNGGR